MFQTFLCLVFSQCFGCANVACRIKSHKVLSHSHIHLEIDLKIEMNKVSNTCWFIQNSWRKWFWKHFKWNSKVQWTMKSNENEILTFRFWKIIKRSCSWVLEHPVQYKHLYSLVHRVTLTHVKEEGLSSFPMHSQTEFHSNLCKLSHQDFITLNIEIHLRDRNLKLKNEKSGIISMPADE